MPPWACRPRASVRRSTSRASTSSGAVFFKPARGWGSRCKAITHKGWTALHHAHGAWHINQSGQSAACVAVHVPVKIRKDLQIPCYPLLP